MNDNWNPDLRIIETRTTYGMAQKDPFAVALSLLRQSHHQCEIDLAEAFDRARVLLAGQMCGCQSAQCERVNEALTRPAVSTAEKP